MAKVSRVWLVLVQVFLFVFVTKVHGLSPPVFASVSYIGTINENSPTDTTVVGITILATDADGDAISYSILSSAGPFKLKTDGTKVLTNGQSIDYETTNSYTLTIQASAAGLTATATITINVVNINEAPTFGHSVYTASISENSVSGTDIISIPATDVDSGDSLTYTLTGTGSSSFNVLSTGVIEVSGSLDFETKSTYTLTVKAADTAGLFVTATIIISVTDVNENPSFSSAPYSATVAENDAAASVVTATASDVDAGNTVSFSLSGSGSSDFAIHATSGVITLSQALDYEQRSSYSLTVAASDSNGGLATTSLTVTVTNSNDSPISISSSYTASIDENVSVGTKVVQTSATDQDGDSITYSLSGSSDFNITSTGMITTAKTLDFETTSSYSLTVSFSDGIATVTKAVSITVVNKNDAPSLPSSPFTASVAEDTAVGTNVYNVSAVDADGDSVVYSLSGAGSTHFSINSLTGAVTTTKALSFEAATSYSLTIKVTDSNGGEVTTTLTISVTNTNDSPTFLGAPYSTTVEENLPSGTSVLKLSALDEDSGDSLTYSLSGTNSGHFSIGSSSGLITTAQSLDYETMSSYSLTVSVSDGTASTSSTITITVTNKNDPPVFSNSPYSSTVDENAAGSAVYTVSATDADTSDTVTYFLTGSGSADFTVNPSTGVVTLTRALDYERLSSYSLTVYAIDGQVAVSTNLNVTVNNLNDAPVFLGTPYATQVLEDLSSATQVLKVAASDEDSSDTLTYSLSGTNSGHFAIGGSTGEITTAQALDYESVSIYSLTVTVNDGTTSVTSPVSISVTNGNDSPTFVSAPYNVSVNENDISATVYTVTATDQDSDTLTYSLSGSGSASFSIHSASGVVSLTSALNYEQVPLYTLTVHVSDGHGGTATTSLTVNVQDQNDDPVFQGIPYVTSINENLAIGSTVFRAIVRDEDSRDTLTYSLSGINGSHFQISSIGVIQTAAVLDFEKLNSYSLTIAVSDSTSTVNQQITVSVVDANDSPVFVNGPYSVSVEENNATASVYTVSATDADNDTLRYYLSGPGSDIFLMNYLTGLVTLTQALDYESKVSYTLSVLVFDGNGGSNASTLTVNVVNQNDPPMFLNTPYSVAIDEDTTSGSRVIQTSASDQDSSDALTYSISGTNSGYFSISNTGIISTSQALDFENVNSYSLTVSVNDGTATTSTPLTISINNVNDIPVFSSASYNVSVNENTTASTSIARVSATDQDGDTLTFSFVGMTSSDFTIHSSTGVISAAVNLNYETISSYTLTVQADDGKGGKSFTTLTVSLVDLNDEVPIFGSAVYNGHVTENAATGTSVMIVTAKDQDSSDSTLAYNLAGSNSTHFSISSSGLIQTASTIDHESIQSYSLTLTATDSGGNTGMTTVIISVFNAIDNYPVFDKASYSANISEDSSPGTSVLQVTATDADSGDNVVYSISGADSSNFTINENNGVISTNAELDREAKDSYVFTVTATDKGSQSTTTTVTIAITDENDNSPICSQAVYTASVTENATIGQSIATVSCSDIDASNNGQVTYSITAGASGKFTMNSNTGVISTSATLDYESTSRYTISIQASDTGSLPKQTTTSVIIDIRGINEHGPSFIPNNTYELSLVEDISVGHDVITVSASDADGGSQGQVTYAIMSGDTYGNFAIDRTTGLIEIRKSLDYEISSQLQLTVVATDGDSGSPLSATATVVINIVDSNDNYPVCNPSLLTPAVLESAAPGSTVVMLNCSDADSGMNSDLSYTIANGNSAGTFNISSSGLISTVLSLDYESTPTYSLTVTIRDNGVSPKSSQVTVVITVSPVNEHTPVFTNSGSYSVSVSEDSTVGSELIRVTATDADGANTAHGIVTYSILSGNVGSTFHISPPSGAISIVRSLDRESASSYSLVVKATDGTNEANATVLVTVSDVNDNTPVCSPTSYAASISEDAVVGSSVLQVTCSDSDEGINGLLVFSVLSGNTNTDLSVDANGTIRTARALDYETTPSYVITVKSRDSSSPSSTQKSVNVEVTIDVTPVNEHAPTFTSSSYAYSVQEDTAIGTSLLKVTATDADSGPQGEIFYSLLPLSAPFYIDASSGIIRIKNVLDRESSASSSLTVTAHDNDPVTAERRSANVSVVIMVTDVNDNVPVFSPTHYKVAVAENTTIGTSVSQIYCTDSDLGANGDLVYSITQGDPSGYFNVSSNGTVTTIKPLDYEALQSYALTVQARDSSSPISAQLVSITHLDIVVKAINEHAPVFSQSDYNITISESTAIGTSLLDVDATDSDLGPQGTISFSMTSGSPFYIDQNTGVISLKELLDYETAASYFLVITATDGDTVSPKYTTAKGTVLINDENDNAPTFTPTIYSVTIAENTTVGTAVVTLTCADADSGTNGQYNMAIVSGNTGTGFSVDNAGVITVATTLDMETTQSYSLVITATDQNTFTKLTGTAKVSITITDINEHAPIFSNGGSYTASISETSSIGSLVTNVSATDNDHGQTYGVVTYDITSGNEEDKFVIRPLDGAVFVKKSLDRESTASYTLQIEATDQDPVSPKSTLASLLITILDENDNAPVCDPTIYSNSIAEDVAIGTLVAQITCTDNDVSPNVITSYAITSGNSTLFQVSSSGLVTTAGALDYESVKEYVLVITITDGGTVPKSSQVTVSVQVSGTNEHAPVFGSSLYSSSHLENTAIGSTIATVTATDQDHGADGSFSFFIHSGNDDGRFLVDYSSGELELKKSFDRETVDFYNITIGAVDGGTPNKTSYTTVSVTVLDVNDNAPNCSQSAYVFQVPENATLNSTIVSLDCTDLDEDDNSLMTYRIIVGNTNSDFTINNATGAVTLANTLNRESTVYYDLIVLVRDNGTPRLHTQVSLSIEATAINEFTPSFTNNGFYNITLNEDAVVGTTVLTAQAHDSDSGEQGHVLYTMVSGDVDGTFQLGTKTGALVLRKALNFEERSCYSLVIRATDGATGVSVAKYSDAVVNITINDINDNAPLCHENFKVIQILESAVVGTIVFKANCTDSDSGGSGSLSYSIVTGNDDMKFNVTSNGDVILINLLSFEITSLYNLVMAVKDDGIPFRSVNITLTVDVQPVNEFVPTFAQGNYYQLDVLENMTLGTIIFKAQVQDNDTGIHGLLTYRLASGNEQGQFYLDAATGRLILVSQLDRETLDHYNLTIAVQDGALQESNVKRSNVTVYIKVMDVNDNEPRCTPRLYSVDISESIKVGSNITAIICTDQDGLGPNSQLTYTFDRGNTGNHFRLENNTIIVANSLDHEVYKEYSLVVNVSDGGSPSYVTVVMVTVYVRPENDYAPLFQYSSYSTNISEWTAIGTKILDINATDADRGIHGNLEYSITSGLNGGIDFMIDKISGVIEVGSQLDRETRDIYVLNITVKDKGLNEQERLSQMILVTILITDENDNPPVFTNDIYTTTIPEDIPVGNSVAKVTTTDADIGNNSVHTYSITGGDGVGKFSIVQSTGVITALPGLDFETKTTYYLSITARDGGSPQLYTVAGVRIFLSDVNDNKPVFHPTLYLTSISEATSAGSDVIPVHANDIDTGSNAKIVYSVAGGDPKNQFVVVNNTGMIRTKMNLDREDLSFYELVIQARDTGIPSLTETVTVNITILDVNDNNPVFGSSAYTVAVAEDAPIGTNVLNISATDADDGLNAKITYSIVSGNTGNKVAIEPSTGIISNTGLFDREKVASYQLTIKAEDAGSPSKYSTTNVHVRIIDRNDNTPSFTDTDYSFAVTENQNIGLFIGEVTATDIDNGTHAQLVYSIEPGSHSNHFTINPLSGRMYTAVSLDRESVSSYRLKVKVMDSATYPNQLYSVTTVSITVLDLNDNAPQFPKSLDVASVAENSATGTLVTRVTATDKDHDANARVTYALSHDNPSVEYFKIDSTTGEVLVSSVLDYESKRAIEVTVTAKDDGYPSKSGSMKLRIAVIDVNDNAPVLSSSFYETEIRSDRSLGPPAILTLNATDRDSGQNANITYEMEKEQALFALDLVNGDITLKASPGSGQKYTFRVRARDSGATPLYSGYANVRIDTIEAEQTMVDIKLDITQEEFEANKEYFLKKLSAMLGADVRIAEIRGESEKKKRRKKRETKRGITITFYAVTNPSTNSTDVQEKINQAKKYLSRDDILKVLLDDKGNLNPALTNSTELSSFKIMKVEATKPTVPPEPSFLETTEGIATIVCCTFLVVLAIIALFCIRIKYKKRERQEQLRQPRLRPKKGVVDPTDFPIYKPKAQHSKIMTLPPSGTLITVGQETRRYDGKAIDLVTGRTYAYNKITGERFWLNEDKRNREKSQLQVGMQSRQEGQNLKQRQEYTKPRESNIIFENQRNAPGSYERILLKSSQNKFNRRNVKDSHEAVLENPRKVPGSYYDDIDLPGTPE